MMKTSTKWLVGFCAFLLVAFTLVCYQSSTVPYAKSEHDEGVAEQTGSLPEETSLDTASMMASDTSLESDFGYGSVDDLKADRPHEANGSVTSPTPGNNSGDPDPIPDSSFEPLPSRPPLPTVAIPSTKEVIDAFIAKMLDKATITFNTPRRMELNETQSIYLLIDPWRTPASLKEELDNLLQDESGQADTPMQVTQASIQISDYVEARLTGAGFKIQANNDESQVVVRNGPTKWVWDVTATEGGKHTVHLTINSKVKIDGSEKTYVLGSYDKHVDVQVTLGTKLMVFYTNYSPVINGIAGSGVLGALYALWKKLVKRKRNPATARPQKKTNTAAGT